MAKVVPNFLAATLITAMLAGCAQIGAPVPPSLELPRQATDLRATRKGTQVHLNWTPPTRITDGQTIQHLGPTRICRSLLLPMTKCDTAVAVVPPSGTPAKTYTDTLTADLLKPDPAAVAQYAVEVLNSSGRSAGLSNQITIPLFPTLAPPQKVEAQAAAEGILLQWTWPADLPQAPGLDFRLRIYRRDESGKSDVRIAEISSTAEPKFLDEEIEWEHTYFYRVTFVSLAREQSDRQVEGDDSPEVKIFARDVFPPGIPSGLQAVFSSVGQPNFIDLTWSPNTDAELAGYNVYRQEEGGPAVKINSEPAKIPTYRDHDIKPGKKYFYSVTAVDLRGNESGRSEESSESVPETQ